MSDFRYISPGKEPCELCGGKDDCRVNATGGVHCRRTDPDSPPIGWRYAGTDAQGFRIFHREGSDGSLTGWAKRQTRIGEAVRKAAKKAGEKPPVKDSKVIAVEKWKRPMTDGERNELARRLVLPKGIFDLLDVEFVDFGWWNEPLGGAAWVTPERDAHGRVIGYNLRYVRRDENGDEVKRNVGKRGLYIPKGWNLMPGLILSPEGMSDTLTLLATGVCAIGRPSATAGAELFAEFAKLHKLHLDGDGHVVAMGEHDRKDNGDWPGRDGAERFARTVSEAIGAGVRVAYPPPAYKDVREYVRAHEHPLRAGQMTLAELGRQLVDRVRLTGVMFGRAAEAAAEDVRVASAAIGDVERSLAGAARQSAAFLDLLPNLDSPDLRARCPDPRRAILRHDGKRRTRFLMADCKRLDCVACGQVKRRQWQATIKQHLGQAERDGYTEMHVFWVAESNWRVVKASLGRTSYFRIDLGDGAYLVAAIDRPTSVKASGLVTLPIDEVRRRLLFTVEKSVLRKGGLSGSRNWKIVGNDPGPREQGWRRIGRFSADARGVADILAYHRSDWDAKQHRGKFFGWSAIDVSDDALPTGMTYSRLIDDVQAGEVLPDFDPFAKPNTDDDDLTPAYTGPPGEPWIDF